MVAGVTGGLSSELLLQYAKVNSNANAVKDEQILKLQEAKASGGEKLPSGSTVSHYA